MTITGIITARSTEHPDLGRSPSALSPPSSERSCPRHRHPTATSGIDWLEVLVQPVVAVIGVFIVAAVYTAVYSRRGIRRQGARR